MDDLLGKKVTSDETSSVEKKIEMKYIKDGKTYRTFILNLEYFIEDEKMLDKIINDMKKSFGTSCIHKLTDFGAGYGFSGDLEARIKSQLKSKYLIPESAFKR